MTSSTCAFQRHTNAGLARLLINGVCQDSIIPIAVSKSAATEKIPERDVLNRGPLTDAPDRQR
jgi:hypothetical protein